jgi:hypothetical protein
MQRHDVRPNEARTRIVVFADWDDWVARALLQELLRVLTDDPTRVVAVCVPRSQTPWRDQFAHALRVIIGWAKRLGVGDRRYLLREPRPENLRALARRHGFELLVATDLERVDAARPLWNPQSHAMLSLFWKRRFHEAFLARFDQTVNYHNGRVPDYRGLRATAWSVYRRESHSGFTFHRMNAQFDLGDVLVEGEVPIEAGMGVFDIERAKTRLAASRLRAVVDAIASKHLNATP